MDDVNIPLPGGWIKTYSQRKTGASMGSWDIYLKSPMGKRLRSNVELIKHCKEKNLCIDPGVVNMDRVLPKDHESFRKTKNYSRIIGELGPLIVQMSPDELAEVEGGAAPELEERLKSLKNARSRGQASGMPGARPKRMMVPLAAVKGLPIKPAE